MKKNPSHISFLETKSLYISSLMSYVSLLVQCTTTFLISIKWPIFRQTGKIGTGKNTKSFFFPTGLEDMF